MLAHRVAIITGASSGIGAATAVAFGRQGMRVALLARRADRLDQVADAARAAGGQALAVAGDVRDPAAVAHVVEQALTAYGRIDVLLNNAGLGRLGWLEQLEPGDVRLQIEVNLLGAIEVAQRALPHMIRQRSGHIINLVSLAGKIGTPTYSVYAATKFGLAGFSQALRREAAPWGVRVSAVYPGSVETEWGQHAGYPRRTRTAWPRMLRLSADDVARAIVRLVERPRREVYLPAAGRLAVWLDRLAPQVGDWLAAQFVRAERRGS